MTRGEIWWADLAVPRGSGPGYRRPVVIIQSDAVTRTAIQTVVVAALTTNTRLAAARGNIALDPERTGLPRESVVNVSQVYTMDKRDLTDRIASLTSEDVDRLDAGLRLMLSL